MNRKGGEIERKRQSYARMGIGYYVVYDPFHVVMRDDLGVHRLRGGSYELQGAARFPELGLGMTLWEGEFEDLVGPWLRWTDRHGALIPTGNEKAEQERLRAEQASTLVDRERRRADRLEALLRRAGIDPEQDLP